jgi:SAM-dependent methyltransferase
MSNENVVNDFKIFLNALPVQPDKDYYCNPIYLPLFDAAKYGDSSASFYDQLYPTIEAGVLTTLKRLAGEGPVLDLGIGTGRVGIPLSQSGIELHGIEASPAMIAALRKHTGGTDIHVIQGDFATTPLGGPYQLVYSLVSTFLLLPTLEQQKECFKNIAAHLKKDGCFVSEVYESESSFPEPDSTKIPIITKTVTEE